MNIDAQLLGLTEKDVRKEAGGAGAGTGTGSGGVEAAGADASPAGASGTDDTAVAMQGGCICCTLKEDLLLEVTHDAGRNVVVQSILFCLFWGGYVSCNQPAYRRYDITYDTQVICFTQRAQVCPAGPGNPTRSLPRCLIFCFP